jgi:predicted TIM-barrel fold metal-dependent hydrolase
MAQWIDTHVHLFTEATKGESPVIIDGGINTVDHYLKSFGNNAPQAVVVVDFSKAKQSDHVVATVEALNKQAVPAQGIIRGNIEDERTFDWITRPEIAGIRLYGKDSIPDFAQDKEKWDRLFNLVRQHDKHICLFGAPGLIRKLAENLPDDLTLLIDHIGMGDAAKGASADSDFNLLLDSLASRHKTAGPVFFKGPGYRTSFEINKTTAFIEKILEKFGDSQLLLGASDAPFAGPVVEKSTRYEGKKNQELVGYHNILDYLNELIEKIATDQQKSFEMLQMQFLYSNAQKLYQFEAKAQQAA